MVEYFAASPLGAPGPFLTVFSCPGTGLQEEQITPTKSRLKKDKVEPSREAQKDKRSTGRKKGLQGPAPGALTPLSDLDQSSLIGEQSQEKILR